MNLFLSFTLLFTIGSLIIMLAGEILRSNKGKLIINKFKLNRS